MIALESSFPDGIALPSALGSRVFPVYSPLEPTGIFPRAISAKEEYRWAENPVFIPGLFPRGPSLCKVLSPRAISIDSPLDSSGIFNTGSFFPERSTRHVGYFTPSGLSLSRTLEPRHLNFHVDFPLGDCSVITSF